MNHYNPNSHQYYGVPQPMNIQPQTNTYHHSNDKRSPQGSQNFHQINPMLPGLQQQHVQPHTNSQKRISYMSRVQARQNQSFSVQPEPLIKSFAPTQTHNIDASIYQHYHQTSANRGHTTKNRQPKPKPQNIHNALPAPHYESSTHSTHTTSTNTTEKDKTHKHKISNQEPITKFAELNQLKKQTNKLNKNAIIQNVYPSQTRLQHNNTQVSNVSGLNRTITNMTELTDMNDMSNDDNLTTITMDTINTANNPHHTHSLSRELQSFQSGNRQQLNNGIIHATKGKVMPKSSLALMNVGLTDSSGKLTKDSILLINSTSQNEALLQMGQSTKSIMSDVSGMSSISSYQPKLVDRYQSERSDRSNTNPRYSYTSFASTDLQSPVPKAIPAPNMKTSFSALDSPNENEYIPTPNSNPNPNPNPPSQSQSQIAYSSVDRTGKHKSFYRFILNDRNREIAIGDIVKAPIPAHESTQTKKRFNAIVNDKLTHSDMSLTHYVGIVKYLGTNKAKKMVSILGLELMDPIGNCDGRRLEDNGEFVRHFQTKRNYAVFVSVEKVVKITPGHLLSTLTEAIQKLNTYYISALRTNNANVKRIKELTERNTELSHEMMDMKENGREIQSRNIVSDNNESNNVKIEPISPASGGSYTSHNSVSDHGNDMTNVNSERNAQSITVTALRRSTHQTQPSFTSGYGTPNTYGHVMHARGVSISTANSTKLGALPTPELRHTQVQPHMHHKSNISQLELMPQQIMSGNGNIIVRTNQIPQYTQNPNTQNPNTQRRRTNPNSNHSNHIKLSPQPSIENPVTPPQPVLHQITITNSQPIYATIPNNTVYSNNTGSHLKPVHSLQQIGIQSIPASPPGMKELTPSPQPPMQIHSPKTPILASENNAKTPPSVPYVEIKNNHNIILSPSPNPTPNPMTIPNPQTSFRNQKPVFVPKLIDKHALKGVIRRKSEDANRLRFIQSEIGINRAKEPKATSSHSVSSASDSENEQKAIPELEKADSGEMTALMITNNYKPKLHRRRSSVMSSQHVPPPNVLKQETHDSLKSDGYNAEDEIDHSDAEHIYNSDGLSNTTPKRGYENTLNTGNSLTFSHNDNTMDVTPSPMPYPEHMRDSENNSIISSDEDGLGKKTQSKHSYSQSFEIANKMSLIMSSNADTIDNSTIDADNIGIANLHNNDLNRLSQPNISIPYTIQVTPPYNPNENKIGYNIQIIPTLGPNLPTMQKKNSLPILSKNSDSDSETQSMTVESGNKSPIPRSLQGTPNPSTPYTPFNDDEEAKQSQPIKDEMDHFDEEHDEDGSPNTQIQTIQKKTKRKFGKKSRSILSRSASSNYDDNDPYRAPWDAKPNRNSSANDGYASPISVNHGVGYDHALNPNNTDIGSSSSERMGSDTSSVSTDHELEKSETESDASNEESASESDKNSNLLLPLSSLLSESIVESHDETGEYEDEDEDENEPSNDLEPLPENESDNADKLDTEENKIHMIEDNDDELDIDIDSSQSDSGAEIDLGLEKLPNLKREDTGEIGKQSYDLGAPPSRHHRQDTLHLQHKKRGSLTGVEAFSPSPSPVPKDKLANTEQKNAYDGLELNMKSHSTEDYENDVISDMDTPHPTDNAIETEPTMFEFAENEENDGLGPIEVKNIISRADKKQIEITPISNMDYGIIEPPKEVVAIDRSQRQAQMDTPISSMAYGITEPPKEVTNRIKIQQMEQSTDNESHSEEEIMTMAQFRRHESERSQQMLPKHAGLHSQMSSETREFVTELGIAMVPSPNPMMEVRNESNDSVASKKDDAIPDNYTGKMKQFVPNINTKSEDLVLDSAEIDKQIKEFVTKNSPQMQDLEDNTHRKRRKSHKKRRSVRKSPKKVYSPNTFNNNNGIFAAHSPYDQHISRPELNISDGSRNQSVKSKRSHRSSSSSKRNSTQSHRSKRNSTSHRRKSKTKKHRQRNASSDSSHSHSHSQSNESVNSSEERRMERRKSKKQRRRSSHKQRSNNVMPQPINNGQMQFYASPHSHGHSPQNGFPPNGNNAFMSPYNNGMGHPSMNHRHFQSHSMSHLPQMNLHSPNNGFESPNQYQQSGMNNRHPSHSHAVSVGALDFHQINPNNMFQPSPLPNNLFQPSPLPNGFEIPNTQQRAQYIPQMHQQRQHTQQQQWSTQ